MTRRLQPSINLPTKHFSSQTGPQPAIQNPLAIWMLVLALLAAQSISLWHSEVHPFHQHTAACDGLSVMDHKAADKLALAIDIPVFEFAQPVLWQAVSVFFSSSFPAYFGRAPPLL